MDPQHFQIQNTKLIPYCLSIFWLLQFVTDIRIFSYVDPDESQCTAVSNYFSSLLKWSFLSPRFNRIRRCHIVTKFILYRVVRNVTFICARLLFSAHVITYNSALVLNTFVYTCICLRILLGRIHFRSWSICLQTYRPRYCIDVCKMICHFFRLKKCSSTSLLRRSRRHRHSRKRVENIILIQIIVTFVVRNICWTTVSTRFVRSENLLHMIAYFSKSRYRIVSRIMIFKMSYTETQRLILNKLLTSRLLCITHSRWFFNILLDFLIDLCV